MPIIIHDITGEYQTDDHIIVYANNKKVGAAKITGEFPLVISAWQAFTYNDLFLPGYESDDIISVKLYDSSSQKYINLTSDFDFMTFDSQMFIEGSITNLSNQLEPLTFTVDNIYPNPFNPKTQINISILQSGLYEFTAYNLLGQVVHSDQLVYDIPGQYTITWNAQNYISGTYIATISSGTQLVSKKLTLMK